MKLDVVGIRLVKERELEYDEPINSPQKACELIANEIKDMDREVMMSINLNTKNEILNAHVVCVGDINTSRLCIKNICKSAILSNATRVMLFHNHPSGHCEPSNTDVIATEKIESALELLEIELLDHIIITPKFYYSLKEDEKWLYDTELPYYRKNNDLVERIKKDDFYKNELKDLIIDTYYRRLDNMLDSELEESLNDIENMLDFIEYSLFTDNPANMKFYLNNIDQNIRELHQTLLDKKEELEEQLNQTNSEPSL